MSKFEFIFDLTESMTQEDLNNNQLVQLACEIELKLKQCNSELESRIPSKAAEVALEVG